MSKETVMQHHTIMPPRTHPYVARFNIDPVDLGRLQRMMEDRTEVQFLGYDDAEPDAWPVRIGCASPAVVEAIEDAWG